MENIDFENNRWSKFKQKEVFRHRLALDFLRGLKKDALVLDYGCGDGFLLELLKKEKIKAVGFDISEKGASRCRKKGLNASAFEGDKRIFEKNKYDCVVSLDVLEHVYEPGELLDRMIKLSKEYLIIGVPNFSSLPARIQMLFGKTPENNKPNKGHIYWFNYNILNKILSEKNLKIVDIKMNTFWENKFLLGYLMKKLLNFFPNLFALSFVVKVKK